MARKRMIDISINHDKALNSLSDFAARLYFMVLPHTDNFGRFEGDAELIKARCLSLSKRPVRKIEEAVIEICQADLWTRYRTKRNKLVLQYNKEAFEKINAFLIKNRDNPEYPEFEEGDEILGKELFKQEPKPLKEQEPEKQKEEKIKYQDLVLLTDKEYTRLCVEFGEPLIKEAIEFLDLWFKEKGDKVYIKYSSHNAMLRRWVIDAVKEKRARKAGFNNGNILRYKTLKTCQYCKGQYENINLHELGCEKAPKPAPNSVVKKIVDDLTDNFKISEPEKGKVIKH